MSQGSAGAVRGQTRNGTPRMLCLKGCLELWSRLGYHYGLELRMPIPSGGRRPLALLEG